MIDPLREKLIRLSKAVIPGAPSICTRWRWCLHGVRGVRLESVRVGGRRYTSAEAVGRFLLELNSPNTIATPPSRAAEEAGAALERMGA